MGVRRGMHVTVENELTRRGAAIRWRKEAVVWGGALSFIEIEKGNQLQCWVSRLQRQKYEDPCVSCVQSEIARFCNARILSRGTYGPYDRGGGVKLVVTWGGRVGLPPDAN